MIEVTFVDDTAKRLHTVNMTHIPRQGDYVRFKGNDNTVVAKGWTKTVLWLSPKTVQIMLVTQTPIED